MLLLEESLKLSSDKRSDLWYEESDKRGIPLEMDNGYVAGDCTIFYDGDFEEMMVEFGIRWDYSADSDLLTMVENGVSYEVDVVSIPNRFDASYPMENIFILDTLRLKK